MDGGSLVLLLDSEEQPQNFYIKTGQQLSIDQCSSLGKTIYFEFDLQGTTKSLFKAQTRLGPCAWQMSSNNDIDKSQRNNTISGIHVTMLMMLQFYKVLWSEDVIEVTNIAPLQEEYMDNKNYNDIDKTKRSKSEC